MNTGECNPIRSVLALLLATIQHHCIRGNAYLVNLGSHSNALVNDRHVLGNRTVLRVRHHVGYDKIILKTRKIVQPGHIKSRGKNGVEFLLKRNLGGRGAVDTTIVVDSTSRGSLELKVMVVIHFLETDYSGAWLQRTLVNRPTMMMRGDGLSNAFI
jgi:hypothetical protein